MMRCLHSHNTNLSAKVLREQFQANYAPHCRGDGWPSSSRPNGDANSGKDCSFYLNSSGTRGIESIKREIQTRRILELRPHEINACVFGF